MIVGSRACCTPAPIILFWQPHYSSEEKMNATCQRTVNCVSGCAVRADSREVGLHTHNWLPFASVQPTQAFPRDCVAPEEVMGERRKDECEKETNGGRKWAERVREKKGVSMWLLKVCLAKMVTMVPNDGIMLIFSCMSVKWMMMKVQIVLSCSCGWDLLHVLSSWHDHLYLSLMYRLMAVRCKTERKLLPCCQVKKQGASYYSWQDQKSR